MPNPPVKGADCPECWALYGRWWAVQVALSRAAATVRSVGRAKGGGQSSKAKGRGAVQIVASLLCEHLGLQPADVFVKAGSQTGVDLHLSPVARAAFPYAIEVKCVEALNIWQALHQAADNATPDSPAIVFFKRAKSPMYVALDARVFLQQLRRS